MVKIIVAELVSAYPTAGGMYFVTKHVVPPDHVAFWAWIVGWCNFLGQTAGVTSVAFTVSQMILAAASMRSNLVDGSYSFSPWAHSVKHRDWQLTWPQKRLTDRLTRHSSPSHHGHNLFAEL